VESNKITLGSKVKDTITGFQGIATGRAEYLLADPSVLVEAPVGADNKSVDCWIKESRLEVVVPVAQ
jgi:hypothetical protein